MARKAVHLQPAGSLTPRDRIWAAMRAQRRFSYESIEDTTRVHEDTTRSYVNALIAGGYVVEVLKGTSGRTARGHYFKSEFELVRDVGVNAPRVHDDGTPVVQGGVHLNMWRAMRTIKQFDYRALVAAASTAELPVAVATAKRYIGYLHLGGYLAEVRPAKNGRGAQPAIYRLLPSKWTGPRAPMVQRVHRLFDPNLGKIVWAPDPAEVADGQH